MVIWFIGLSGAGKSTLGGIVYKAIKKKNKNTVWLDGDSIRKIYNDQLGHSNKDREINAKRISNMTRFLSSQNINVVGSILSNFPKWQKWNKKYIKDYSQVYIKVPIETLIERNNKKLYKPAIKKKNKNVVGIDIKFHEPLKSNLIIYNDFKPSSLKNFKKEVFSFIKKKYKIEV